MKKIIYLMILLLVAGLFYACSKENNNPSDPCAGVNLTLTGAVTNTPAGQSSGAINATAGGGNSGFTYKIGSGSFVSSGNFTGLAAGSYTITAKNADGCTVSQSFTVSTINVCTGVNIVVTGTVTAATTGQTNGAITATATGSTNITYSINGTTFQATGNFTGLAAGTYTVTAKNADGCTGTQTFIIPTSNPCTGVTIVVTGTVTDASTGQNNGAISASATGSTNLTYSINGTTFQASGNFTGLGAGTYTITAKNADGCMGTQTFTVGTVNPCAGVTINVSTTVTNATQGQNNGAITATATGGSGFTYSINGTTFQASGTFTGLAAGTYTVTAKNSNGCTGTATAIVATTNPCAGVTINVSSTTTAQVPCGGSQGSILVNASGSSGYQYSINGGTFQSSNSFAGLAAGSYSITVKDANNCSGTANATVSTAPAGPNFSAVKAIILTNCLSCHNNSNQQGGMNWQVDCNIVANGQAIKNRAVDQAGTASQMPQPPNPPLSAADRQKILDWLAAGGGYNH